MPLRGFASTSLLALGLGACALASAGGPARAPQQEEFFTSLSALCGRSFAGAAIEAPEGDTVFTGRPLVMHVAECTDGQVVIPVRVGDDRSRTWVVSRVPGGLQLTHVHRHADGSEDENSRYGGRTLAAGQRWRQDFPADDFSVRAVPGRATQTWTMEIWPDRVLDYSLHRTATGLRYRFRFDLSRPGD